MERRMAKDGAIIVVNDADVDFYESVGFEVIKPEKPASPREIGEPVEELDPKPIPFVPKPKPAVSRKPRA